MQRSDFRSGIRATIVFLAAFLALPLWAQFLTFRNLSTSLPAGHVGLTVSGGIVYYADSVSHAIGRIDPNTGAITLIAGVSGSSGALDGAANQAKFASPNGVAVDASGNIYVADTSNHKIRRVTSDGWVSTIAGSGFCGATDGNGSAAQFCGPKSIAFDNAGNLWVADSSNNRIRKVEPNGDVTTVAGSTAGSSDGAGTSARFSFPASIAFNGVDAFYVADSSNNTIRRVTLGGGVTTLAGLAGSQGNRDGTGSAANFYVPTGVSVATDTGDVFVSDYFNDAVRRVSSSGVVTTPGGIVRGPGSDEGTGYEAQFNRPRSIAAINSNTVFVSDNAGILKKGTASIADAARIDSASGYVGQVRQLTVNPLNATQFAWTVVSKPSQSTAAISDPLIATPTFTPDFEGTYTFRLDATQSGTGSSITRVSLIVTCQTPPPAPTVTRISGNEPSCPTDPSLVLEASAGYDSYRWITSGAPPITHGTGRTLTIPANVTETYSVLGTINGCSSSGSYRHSAYTQPTSQSIVRNSGSETTCATETAGTFSPYPGYGSDSTVQWGYRTTPGGTWTELAGRVGNTYLLDGRDFPAPGNYYLVGKVTPPCGFNTVFTQERFVSVVVPISVVITPSSPSSCPGSPVVMTATASGRQYNSAYDIWWQDNGTTVKLCANTNLCTFIGYPGRTYYASARSSGICYTRTPDVVVATSPVPAQPQFTTGDLTCEGMEYHVTNPDASLMYRWMNGATGTSMISPYDGSVDVTATSASGCSTKSTTIGISINNPPHNPVVTADGPTTFCAGGSVRLTASLDAGEHIAWLWSNGASTQSIIVTESGSYSFTATNTQRNCSVTSAAKVVTVNAPPIPVITSSGSTTLCPGGSVTFTASAASSWKWSNGETTRSINVSTAGSYSVETTDASGCKATSAPTVVTMSAPTATVTASSATTFCEGGSVTLTANAGQTYFWSNGAITRSITVTSSGSYSVTVTDAAGCAATSTATAVTVNPLPPQPAIASSGATTFCAGGSVTLTAPAGVTYLWSNNATAQSITLSQSGTYSVSVTDANGCSATSAPTSVTVNTAPSVSINVANQYAAIGRFETLGVTESSNNDFCNGQTAGLTAIGGSTVLWSSGETARTIFVTQSGTYTATVTDANGCSNSASVVVTFHASPEAVITANGPTTFCEGGSVTLTAPASAAYRWSNGATTQSITASTSGSYGVTVTNASGCGATSAPVSVTVNTAIAPTITGPSTFCAGSSVTLTASNSASYLWSNGATSPSINVNAAGSYVVTTTDANGCSAASAPFVVTAEGTAVTISGGRTNVCPGEMIHLTSSVTGGSAASYQWYGVSGQPLPGETGPTLDSAATESATSYYFLRIASANGCTVQSNTFIYTVTPPSATISASSPTTFCSGGSVILSANDGASHLWSNGATSSWITVNTPGDYTVIVTNAAGCAATSAPTTVAVNSAPTAVISADGPTTFCQGGSVTLTVPGGYDMVWWSNGATTPSINVTSAGSYSATVTNASGCSTTSSATTVTVNDAPVATVSASGPTTFCAGGSVTLTASAGASYVWSTGATTQSINATSSGNFSVTVTNASGCSTTSSATTVTVNGAPVATVSASGPTTFCVGGSVTLTASAGAAYLWSTGATTQSINGTASGSYSVTVTNASGCSTTSSPTTVMVNAAPAATISASGPTTFCVGGSVTLTASAASSYLWSNGATTPSIVVTTAGSYSVTVTSAAGCSATSAPTSVVVNANPATPTITASGPATFCAGGSVTLTAPAGFTYLWSTGATSQAIVASAAGSYSATVTNASGCSTSSAATSVTVNAATSITQQPLSKSILKNTTTQLTVTATGTGTLTYQWYRGSSPSTATPISGATGTDYTTPKLARGTYTYWVRVTGSCGIANSSTATITAQ